MEEIVARNRVRVADLAGVGAGDIARYLSAHWDFVALGVVTGVASGIIGIGGGLVMNTYMGAFTNMPQHEIVATSLLVAVPIGASGSLVHLRAGRVNPRSCGVVAGAAIVACGAASRFLAGFDDSRLKKLFTCVLVGSAVSMMR